MWRVFIYLGSETGVRVGEEVVFRWSDVDFKAKKVTVDSSAGYAGKEFGEFEKDTKNHEPRYPSLSEKMISMLNELKAEQDLMGGSPYLFTKRDNLNEHMHPDTPYKHLRTLGEKIGLPELHPHKLRHTAATLSLNAVLSVYTGFHGDIEFVFLDNKHLPDAARFRISETGNNNGIMIIAHKRQNDLSKILCSNRVKIRTVWFKSIKAVALDSLKFGIMQSMTISHVRAIKKGEMN